MIKFMMYILIDNCVEDRFEVGVMVVGWGQAVIFVI